jgi:hypothetical protein
MRMMFSVAAVAVLLAASFMTAGQDTVKVGDPLRIYLRRSPEQNMTFLNLYKAFNASAEDKNEYSIVLGPKGSGWDSVVAYMPTSEKDNSLKYAPNSSISGQYNFSILGRAINDDPDARYRIKVTVDIDYRRSGDFKTDQSFSFIIDGASDAKIHERNGMIGTPSDELKRMDSSAGGRVRITISRDDNELNSLVLYTGYRQKNCHLTLPMSRENAEPSGTDGGSIVLILLLVVLAIGAFVGYFIIDRVCKKKEPEKRPTVRKGRGK